MEDDRRADLAAALVRVLLDGLGGLGGGGLGVVLGCECVELGRGEDGEEESEREVSKKTKKKERGRTGLLARCLISDRASVRSALSDFWIEDESMQSSRRISWIP